MPLRANTQRLWDSLAEMGKIGATENGGCCRLVLTDEDRRARDLFVSWCDEAGCAVTIDRVGNIFARRAGDEPSRPAVASGSHLDTQPHGGRFDGVFGVLAALEVIRGLNDAGIRTRAPIDAVVWSNEEGVRYHHAMLGSGVFCGAYDLDAVLASEDAQGKRYGDELERIGYAGALRPGARAFDCFLEAHIEQGPILEREGKTIGLVDRVQGYKWFDVAVTGADGHAGTTPMDLRRDALAGAAEMVLELERIGRRSPADSRLTVGFLDVIPNAPSTIPGRVAFGIDLRNPSRETADEQEVELIERFRAIAAARGLEVAIRRETQIDPVRFDPACVATLAQATRDLGYPHREMISGALHDACWIARVAPTAMLFVPCKDGVSHNEAESAEPDDLGAGCSVLLNAMLARAGIA